MTPTTSIARRSHINMNPATVFVSIARLAVRSYRPGDGTWEVLWSCAGSCLAMAQGCSWEGVRSVR